MSIIHQLSKTIVLAACLVFGWQALAQNSDLVLQSEIQVGGSNPERALEKTVADTRAIFYNYVPAVDSSTTILKPLRVSGSAAMPVIQMTLRKCVAFICEVVDLDAEIRTVATQSDCAKSYLIRADLSRSSTTLANTYRELNVEACLNKPNTLAFRVTARRGPEYKSGVVQQEVMKMLKLQSKPILQAIQKSLKANGG